MSGRRPPHPCLSARPRDDRPGAVPCPPPGPPTKSGACSPTSPTNGSSPPSLSWPPACSSAPAPWASTRAGWPPTRCTADTNCAWPSMPGLACAPATGSRGDRHYDWALLDVPADDAPTGHAAGHSHLVIRRHRTDELSFYRCHSATPVALATLVDVICCRWAIEEDFQLGKSACGLDQGQTTCWNSWMRWTFISMLVAAVLAVTRLRATAQTTHGRLVRSAPANCSACCGPPCCPRPAATAITCCTGPPGAANTSTARPKHTAAGTTSPPPLRRDTASTITNYSCRV
jgi:hypothetical protein